ncbi:hypothetical protein MYX82_14775 [Acidobacteria bacterium AH-259-D05]|nr:hypothetical protein [Acidobacteria bacterium AH-259-D05]
MKLGLAIPAIIAVLFLANSAYAQKDERLYGVWKMTYYSREGQVVDWTGIMIITPEYFSRNYMAKERPRIQDRYESLADLTEQEKTDMVEALHQKFGGASGTYRLEKDTLFFEPIISATPGLADRHPRRQFELNQDGTRLTLKGTMTRGYAVGEVWEKVQDFRLAGKK